MSWLSAEEPEATATPGCKALETVIVPRPRDIGGFEVRRLLPSLERRSVGPFVFFDQMGPSRADARLGHRRAAASAYRSCHGHLSICRNFIVHRDSLGTVQSIEPGAVNWMTAGRGIVHSERSDAELRKRRQSLYGIQIWVALPKTHEETAPDFTHYPRRVFARDRRRRENGARHRWFPLR